MVVPSPCAWRGDPEVSEQNTSKGFDTFACVVGVQVAYRDVVLGGGGAGDERGRGVLDLHLVQQDIAVLGDLNLTRASHQHLQRTPRT